MSRVTRQVAFAMGVFAVAGLASFQMFGSAAAEPASAASNQVALNTSATVSTADASQAFTPDDQKKMLMQYCTACHNDKAKTAGMSVVPLDENNLQANQATWEKILRRLSL